MGVNMAGNCIVDDEACQEASKQEIIRRYYQSVNRFVRDEATRKTNGVRESPRAEKMPVEIL